MFLKTYKFGIVPVLWQTSSAEKGHILFRHTNESWFSATLHLYRFCWHQCRQFFVWKLNRIFTVQHVYLFTFCAYVELYLKTVTHTKRIDRNLLRKETSFVCYTSSVLRKSRHMKQKEKITLCCWDQNSRLQKLSTIATPPLNTATTLFNEQ